MRRRVIIYASDLAKYTGDNRFCTPGEVVDCFWAKNPELAEELGRDVRTPPLPVQKAVSALPSTSREALARMFNDEVGAALKIATSRATLEETNSQSKFSLREDIVSGAREAAQVATADVEVARTAAHKRARANCFE